jgi:hypothetical protein
MLLLGTWIVTASCQWLYRRSTAFKEIENNDDADIGMEVGDVAAPASVSSISQRTLSLQAAPLLVVQPKDDNKCNTPLLDHPQQQSHASAATATAPTCCGGRLWLPSVPLMLLYITLLSYSGIAKATSALLQCQQSPIDDERTIMYLAGTANSSLPLSLC